MNRFVKKNLFLVGVLALTAVIVAVLLVLSVMQTIEMGKHSRQTEKMRDTNQKLMKQQPPAVQENIELVQEDIAGYRVSGEKMKQFFGQTLDSALQAFCAKTNIDKETLCSRFRAFWDKEREIGGPREQTYRRFRASCCTAQEGGEKALCDFSTWDEALAEFVSKAQQTTMEKIDAQNCEEIFLSSLGLPRILGNDERRLNVFISSMKSSVTEMLAKNKVSVEGVFFTDDGGGISELKTDEDFEDQGRREEQSAVSGGTGEGKASRKMRTTTSRTKRSSKKSFDDGPGGMGMNEMGSASTEEGEVKPADVVRNWEIMSDIAQRIADAKIESLEKLSYGSLTGKPVGSCTFYSYEFTVRGSQKAIRRLMNNLGQAYLENRVYVIRNLSFRKMEDQTQDLIDVAQGILAPATQEDESELSVDAGSTERPGANSRGTSSRGNALSQNNEMSKKVAVQDYFTEQNIYGEIVIGRSDQCEASFTVDYVVFTANIL